MVMGGKHSREIDFFPIYCFFFFSGALLTTNQLQHNTCSMSGRIPHGLECTLLDQHKSETAGEMDKYKET